MFLFFVDFFFQVSNISFLDWEEGLISRTMCVKINTSVLRPVWLTWWPVRFSIINIKCFTSKRIHYWCTVMHLIVLQFNTMYGIALQILKYTTSRKEQTGRVRHSYSSLLQWFVQSCSAIHWTTSYLYS